MARYDFYRGYRCPRCDDDTDVFRDPETGTFGWVCPKSDCDAIGFGFQSRRRARIGLREYRERFGNRSREYR
ncbi:hypothetical protein ACFPYI_09165 [Halomarina salina]|uniref:Uncharacterized protein n=1 Tax=Halomarina salina TaxID=1872699 RepID=A0ABD5RM51_9EURY|nr:hypothetical protein [Halomarina salina]